MTEVRQLSGIAVRVPPAPLAKVSGRCHTPEPPGTLVPERSEGSRVPHTRHIFITLIVMGLMLIVALALLLAISIGYAALILGFSIEGSDYYPWQEGLFVRSPYAVEDGHVTVTDAPGWGIEIDPEWLARSSYRMSEAG